MLNNVNTNVERIIAKIDNDFAVEIGDYVPRVAAWVIDAMSQIDALRKVRKKVKLMVCDRIAYSSCDITSPNLIVYDNKGCTIDKQKSGSDCDDCPSTGNTSKIGSVTPKTVDLVYNHCATKGPNLIAETNNCSDDTSRYNLHEVARKESRNYIPIGSNKIELNFDCDCITIETEVVETYFSETYGEEIPVVPNVGTLLEYLVFYCMYKMLCRGFKHPVFNLGASQYGTNPYYEYNKLKPHAKTAVIVHEQGDINVNDGGLLRSAFYIATFG